MDNQSDQPGEPEAKPSAEELKPAIFDAIGAHMRVHGPGDWHRLRERPEYAHVIGVIAGKSADRRFWRWVAKVREGMPPDHTKPHDGRDANHAHQAWSAEEARRAVESMPVPPPASFFVRRGADGVETIRVLDAVQEAWADLDRAKALIEASDDKPSTRAKRLTEHALARVKLIATVTDIIDRAHDIDALHHRYRQMVAFVEEECAPYPGLRDALLRRFGQANSVPVPSTPLVS